MQAYMRAYARAYANAHVRARARMCVRVQSRSRAIACGPSAHLERRVLQLAHAEDEREQLLIRGARQPLAQVAHVLQGGEAVKVVQPVARARRLCAPLGHRRRARLRARTVRNRAMRGRERCVS
eukprot:6192640-Pleurochrysis_carterae.AAC.2